MESLAAKSETLDAKERILDAAETEFARHGFGGAGMKAISANARVAQGLIHYHFGDKERLYEAVIERRSSRINSARVSALETVDFTAPRALADVFRAFFTPPLGSEGGGVGYARIFASLAVGMERDRALIQRCYDPTAKRFIKAIERASGGSGEDAAWTYLLALGALVSVVGRDERLERLSNGAANLDEEAVVVERLVRFAVGGLHEMLAKKEDEEKGP